MSIANIVTSGLKMRKTSGKLQFWRNCKFPEVFHIFDPLITTFAMDIYIFLESAWQGAADEPIKRSKSWNFFFDSIRVSAIFPGHLARSKSSPNMLIFGVNTY